MLYGAAHIIVVDQDAFSQLFPHNMHGTYIVHTRHMKEHPQMWDAHHHTFLHVKNSKQKQIPWENYLPKKQALEAVVKLNKLYLATLTITAYWGEQKRKNHWG